MTGGNKIESELTCKPLDTYSEILSFLQDPPPWRTLCKELTPHSKLKIKNYEINNTNYEPCLEEPESFCHFNPDHEEPQRYEENKLPKTLVCHDMANGYHDDRFIHGTGNYEAYTFYNWAGIDIFCYFSHHLITIPPLGWINVGHAHGVKVIGTVITEWAEGVVFWEKVLESETSYQNFASALVAIAKTLKFDGWLLNVENKISKPNVLLDFVKHLHKILHQEIPHAELIWYDSVTISGSLNWQNCLNDKNRPFFDACDGLFTNYSWTEADVIKSAVAAGDRINDVYIGIDVWGRNFYGGGHFNTQEALKLVYEHQCSAAIFAPAWTHEALVMDKEDPAFTALSESLDRQQQFLLRDRALWGSLWPFLHTRPLAHLPFTTTFCRGQGRRRWLQGEVVSPQPWYNLRHQQYQPNAAHGPHGYLLSHVDNIASLSRHAAQYEVRGILRCRDRSLADGLQELAERQKLAEGPADLEEPTTDPDSKRDASSRCPPTDRRHKTVKRKIKDVILNLFHAKAPRRESDGPGLEEAEAGPSEAGAGGATRSPSMLHASVKLCLGRADAARRYGLAAVGGERECLEVHYEDAFTGGSCLRINPWVEAGEVRPARLFHCQLEVAHALLVCTVTKRLEEAGAQELSLRLRGATRGGELRVALVPRCVPGGAGPGAAALPAGPTTVYALDPAGERFRSLQRYLLLNENNFYVPVENAFGWDVRYYEVMLAGCRITSVNCHLELSEGAVLLGHLGLCQRPLIDEIDK